VIIRPADQTVIAESGSWCYELYIVKPLCAGQFSKSHTRCFEDTSSGVLFLNVSELPGSRSDADHSTHLKFGAIRIEMIDAGLKSERCAAQNTQHSSVHVAQCAQANSLLCTGTEMVQL
jgi:hypothetical protein